MMVFVQFAMNFNFYTLPFIASVLQVPMVLYFIQPVMINVPFLSNAPPPRLASSPSNYNYFNYNQTPTKHRTLTWQVITVSEKFGFY